MARRSRTQRAGHPGRGRPRVLGVPRGRDGTCVEVARDGWAGCSAASCASRSRPMAWSAGPASCVASIRAPGCVLVVAPPGFGKTTLTAQWARTVADPVAWISVDLLDESPADFWRHVIEAHPLDRADDRRRAARRARGGPREPTVPDDPDRPVGALRRAGDPRARQLLHARRPHRVRRAGAARRAHRRPPAARRHGPDRPAAAARPLADAGLADRHPRARAAPRRRRGARGRGDVPRPGPDRRPGARGQPPGRRLADRPPPRPRLGARRTRSGVGAALDGRVGPRPERLRRRRDPRSAARRRT